MCFYIRNPSLVTWLSRVHLRDQVPTYYKEYFQGVLVPVKELIVGWNQVVCVKC